MNRRLWHRLYAVMVYWVLNRAMMTGKQESRGLGWQRRAGSTRPEVVEFWGGHVENGCPATFQGWAAMQLDGLRRSMDLRDPARQAQARTDLDCWPPRLMICEPPFRAWYSLTNRLVAPFRVEDKGSSREVPIRVLDWHPRASNRIVLNTLAAETAAAANRLGMAYYVRARLKELQCKERVSWS